jgi:predicted NAD/FAD-binding protein
MRLGVGAAVISRHADGVEIVDTAGGRERFDHVILAAHAPDSLATLSDASEDERQILSSCSYSANDVWLHCDQSLMPRRRAAWASWNFLREGNDGDRRVAVSYWMNRLQSIDPAKPLFVTLNPPFEPAPELTFGRFSYDHPQFDGPALSARLRLDDIQGVRRTWFCGAWTRHGFHEDGLASGLAVASRLGCAAPWAAERIAAPRISTGSAKHLHAAPGSGQHGIEPGSRNGRTPVPHPEAGRKAVEEAVTP